MVKSGGIIIPLNPSTNVGSSATIASLKPATCNVPNCNCANSLNSQANAYPPPPPPHHPLHHQYAAAVALSHHNDSDIYIIKETHYTCVQCSVTFVKLNDYMTHLKHEHCVEVFRCILCKQMQLFDNLNLLKEHFFQVHQSHKYDLYKCKLCQTNAGPNGGATVNGRSGSPVFHHVDDLYAHLQSVHHHTTRPNNGGLVAPISANASTTNSTAATVVTNGNGPMYYPGRHMMPPSSQAWVRPID